MRAACSMLAVLVALVLLIPRGDAGAQATSHAGLAPAGIGVDERVGAELPLSLRFQNGSKGSAPLGSFVGRSRPALLVLAYNRCPMLCNLVLRHLADTLRELQLKPGEDFDLVTLSIDPRETPAEVARVQQTALARAGYEGQLERWPFLTGSQRSIAAVAASIGFRYAWDPRTEQYAHPALVTVLTPRGEVAGYLHGVSFTAPELASALQGETQPGLGQALLRCFRPDTARSKYGVAIQTGLRAGAALALSLLALVIVRARSRRP